MNQMSEDPRKSIALRMWRNGYSRNRICIESRCCYETLEKWIRQAGLISDDGELKRRFGRAEAGPARPIVRVFRDPCPRCNVRGDLGCKHRPAQAEEAL